MDQLLLCLQLIWFVGEGRAFELQYKELQQPLQQQGNPATASLQITSINDLPIQPSSAMAGVPASGECHELRRQRELLNAALAVSRCQLAPWHATAKRHAKACRMPRLQMHAPLPDCS